MTDTSGDFERDIALTEGADGEIVAHKANCPDARRMAAEGSPVATMFGISHPLPDDVKRHSCLGPTGV